MIHTVSEINDQKQIFLKAIVFSLNKKLSNIVVDLKKVEPKMFYDKMHKFSLMSLFHSCGKRNVSFSSLIVGFLNDCHLLSHLCGEHLLKALNSVQGVFPLRAGVPEHNLVYRERDGLVKKLKYSLFRLFSYRLSNSNVLHRNDHGRILKKQFLSLRGIGNNILLDRGNYKILKNLFGNFLQSKSFYSINKISLS